jgi:ADP-heptose:LPS heptosyltransferase
MTDVLLRRGALGDVVLLGAVTASSPAPVTVVTDPRYVGLVQRLVGVERAVPWPEDLRDLPVGRRIDLQGAWRHRASGVQATLKKHSLRRRLRLFSSRVTPRPSVPQLYAEACGWQPASPPWFPVDQEPRDVLAIFPGASTPIKRWREENWTLVAQGWRGPVWILGGPGEDEEVARVGENILGAHTLCETGFDQTFEVLKRCRVAVGGDTGLMHLAGAMGAKVVTIFGPTAPEDGFFVYPGEVVQRPLFCRPCTLHRRSRCWHGQHHCMDLPANAVLEAVRRCAG